MRGRGDGGETLIEILFTIVIIDLTVTALISSLATTGSAANAQRISVKADFVLRDYAKLSKAAAEHYVLKPDCTVPLPPLPPGFSVSRDQLAGTGTTTEMYSIFGQVR